jgi:hypothetical protein
MWLTGVESLRNDAGAVTRLRIAGRGFKDRLKAMEIAGGNQATAVELFRDRLKAQPAFSDQIEIRSEGDDPRFPDQVRLFTLEVGLESSAHAKPAD